MISDRPEVRLPPPNPLRRQPPILPRGDHPINSVIKIITGPRSLPIRLCTPCMHITGTKHRNNDWFLYIVSEVDLDYIIILSTRVNRIIIIVYIFFPPIFTRARRSRPASFCIRQTVFNNIT